MHVKNALRVSLTAAMYGILIFFAAGAHAQGNKQISGTVRDEKGNPLAGASISVKGTKKGTTTDSSGSYSISLPEKSSVLLIAFVGHETLVVNTSNSASFNVQLLPA